MIGVAHISLVVSDLERSIGYYTRQLGFKEGERSENERLKICYLHRDRLVLELLEYLAAEGARIPGVFDHLAFMGSDLDACAEQLLDAGLLETRPEFRSSPDGRRLFFITGPDGERLEFLDRYPATLHHLELKLAECSDVFFQAWDRLVNKPGTNRVHDLRVASRRFNVIMAYCSILSSPSGVKTASRRLHAIFALLGRLRDCQVQLDFVHHSDESILDSHLLVKQLEQEEQALNRKLLRKINAFDLDDFAKRLQKYQRKLHVAIHKKKSERAIINLCQGLLEEYRQDLKTCRSRILADNPATIHRFRIAAKKVRYSVEALYDYLGLDPQDIERLRALQDQAGLIQDLTALALKVEQASKIRAGARQMMINLLNTRRDELIARLTTALDQGQYDSLWT